MILTYDKCVHMLRRRKQRTKLEDGVWLNKGINNPGYVFVTYLGTSLFSIYSGDIYATWSMFDMYSREILGRYTPIDPTLDLSYPRRFNSQGKPFDELHYTQYQEYLKAIKNSPQDRLLWGIFADFLDDNNDIRSIHIRTELQSNRTPAICW